RADAGGRLAAGGDDRAPGDRHVRPRARDTVTARVSDGTAAAADAGTVARRVRRGRRRRHDSPRDRDGAPRAAVAGLPGGVPSATASDPRACSATRSHGTPRLQIGRASRREGVYAAVET